MANIVERKLSQKDFWDSFSLFRAGTGLAVPLCHHFMHVLDQGIHLPDHGELFPHHPAGIHGGTPIPGRAGTPGGRARTPGRTAPGLFSAPGGTTPGRAAFPGRTIAPGLFSAPGGGCVSKIGHGLFLLSQTATPFPFILCCGLGKGSTGKNEGKRRPGEQFPRGWEGGRTRSRYEVKPAAWTSAWGGGCWGVAGGNLYKR